MQANDEELDFDSKQDFSAAFQRADSVRSEQSDQSSECRRVSFNHDVQVKRIPKSRQSGNGIPPAIPPKPSISLFRHDSFESGPFAQNVKKEDPPLERHQIEAETNRILRQLEGVECNVSPTPIPPPLPPPPSSGSTSTSTTLKNNANAFKHPLNSTAAAATKDNNTAIQNNSSKSKLDNNLTNTSSEEDSGLPASSTSGGEPSSLQTGDSLSSASTSETVSKGLHGLHALNNLDIAVNGNQVNSMKNYQDLRSRNSAHHRHHHNLDSSGNSAEYSPPLKRNNLPTPPKPPRKAPSSSPPNLRRGISYPGNNSAAHMVNSVMEQFHHHDGGSQYQDEHDVSDGGNTFYSTNTLRRSPGRQNLSPSRLSPSRTCMTDTEILKSPSEVLYAVSDKYRHSNNDRVSHSASQTMHSELQRHMPMDSRYHQDKRMVKPGRAVASSREDLLSDASKHGYDQPTHRRPRVYKPVSRSLDRYVDDDKENNAFKARIHVVSPDRSSPNRTHRKPYKTTINTANDNIIQYRGDVMHNNLYQKNQMYRKPESEHYKVPKNSKNPADYYRNLGIRSSGLISDSDHSSAYFHNGHGHTNGRGNFNSTRLVKNVEHRRQSGSRELDREGRTIRKERRRTYSGCSTSPDREVTPDRGGYSRPKASSRSYSNVYRSPSTSPSRPPRARSSPGRELFSSMMRRVTRTPSTRAMATSRSPIKEIKRAQNDVRSGRDRSREYNGGNSRHRSHDLDDSEARLSKFTEYRGDLDHDHDDRYTYDSQRAMESLEDELARERGRSLPPGANIDSMRDFYKSSQYKSMYALPPSPSRPAPVLDRLPTSSTLTRTKAQPMRSNRVSISEGEVTDGTSRQQRPRTIFHNGIANGKKPQPPVRRGSHKRQAPSPPGHVGARRVVSSDREDSRHLQRMEPVRRAVSSDKGLQQPPYRKVITRKQSLGDTMDSSMSESEGFFGEARPWSSVSEEDLEYETETIPIFSDGDTRAPSISHFSVASSTQFRPLSSRGAPSVATTTVLHLHQPRERRGNVILYDKTPTTSFSFIKEKPGVDMNRRWTSHQSDIDSDYRRDLAINGGLHQEARGRDGGNSIRNRSTDTSPVGRSSSSAREEERRKVLEIEEERQRREREVQLRRGNNPVSRSGSRVSRAGGAQGLIGMKSRKMAEEQESQYSGHSSSSALRKDPVPGKLNRFDQSRVGRVKRSTSNATREGPLNNGPVRREVRKKIPGSVTSSLNSSESENLQNGGGQRSVFLHSACVADIPPNSDSIKKPAPPRALSAESRTDISSAGTTNGVPASNLQKSKKISRSISLLAPWKPKPGSRQASEIHYNNSGIYGPGSASAKPPRPPVPPVRRSATMQRDKKSASSSDLLREDVVAPPPPNLIIQEQHTMPTRNTIPTKVSRSVSMPKDTRLAGWFKRKKRM